jgi:anti-sigma regulatory factor (Ser/Thr protein kinase)
MVDLGRNRKQVDMHDLTDVSRASAAPGADWPEQSPAPAEFSAWLPYHPATAGRARGLLRDFLAATECGELYEADGELVLSELVSNAIRYGKTEPEQLIFVRFEQQPGLLRIEVHDANSGSEPAPVRPGDEDECGRGLLLVEQLAQQWGSGPRGGIGKMVWATVAPA